MTFPQLGQFGAVGLIPHLPFFAIVLPMTKRNKTATIAMIIRAIIERPVISTLHSTLELDRTISIPCDLDDVAYDGGAVLDA